MKLHFDELIAGMQDMMSLHKQGQNIFEMKGGNLFPTLDRQNMWQYARGPKHIHFSDGTKTYSFSGDLADEDTDLEKTPDVPLPDMYANSTAKGKAQVHRADPGSIYFTLQEGTKNPTYTFRHTGDSKWRAIPKRKKARAALAAPLPALDNVNVEKVKEGMVFELENLMKTAQGGSGGLLDFFNHAAGNAVPSAIEGAKNVAMAPGMIGGAPSEGMHPLVSAGLAGAVGGGLGLTYHGAKRHFFNTPEENAREDQDKTTLLKRVGIPALAGAGLNLAQRSAAPDFYEGGPHNITG
jgi:hypothetical protein